MPKKGKGRKNKDKDDSSGKNVPEADKPGPSSQGTGRGRGRGRGQEIGSSRPPGMQQQAASATTGRGEEISSSRPPGMQQQAASVSTEFRRTKESPENVPEPVRFQEEKISPRGRGRGKGSPSQSSPQPFFGSQEPKEPLVSVTEGAAAMKDAPVGKKVLSPAEQEALLSQMTGLSLESQRPRNFPMAMRPNYAIINDQNRIRLYVNYFKLSYDKDALIYHYDIEIFDSDKDKKKGKSVFDDGRTKKEDAKKDVKFVERQKRRNMGKAKCRQIISEAFRTNETLRRFCPVYDGQKNLFTSRPLPCKKDTFFEVLVEVEGKRKTFFVGIQPVVKPDKTNTISLEPLINLYSGRACEIPYEVLLVYETVMSHRDPPFKQVQFRNSFFSLQGDKSPLGGGLEVWFGYHQAVQLTKLGPVVVINLAAKAFHKAGSVIDYANDVLGRVDIRKIPKFQPWQIKNLTDALKGITVKVTHQPNPRRYKVKAVTNNAAKDIIQEINKKKMSVAQYIFEKYRVKLVYPHLPCLEMRSNNTTYIPIELCEIVEGQPKIGKLSADLTSKMIRSTAVAPEQRKREIEDTVRTANNYSKKSMDAFGLLMDLQLMKVDGRIIAAPQLAYAGNANARPDNRGVWRIEDGKKFYRIVKIHNWSLISFADEGYFGMSVLSRYCEFLVKSGRKCGMQIDRPESIHIHGRGVTAEEALIRAKKSGAEFVIVILSRRDNYHSYDEIKFLADFKYNLVTQCMEDKTLSRINDQITTNVCLKINVKLGGINHILFHPLRIFKEPVIVFGIDAIHWPRGNGYPSILSVVGSLNNTASRYALTCDLQKNEKKDKLSQEIIKNMKKPALEILGAFQDINKRHPHRIIVFRDGVSEGQFQHALDHEVSGMQDACKELFGIYIPITYVVVQKRHHTRFFPANPSQGIGKNRNVPAGTGVDKDVTHPVFFDFFICSHEGIQGTSKPAHYTVLHDDNKFQTEELQQLCYFLCHTYVRCTRSVSLPAPIMYADLAAARAKKYADLFTKSDTTSVASEDSQRDLPPQVEEAIRKMKSFQNNMFYV